MIRKHFYFSGRVQGVGFRYRSCYLAKTLGLTGWVKNLWDDRVEMEVQGEMGKIQKLMSLLAEQRFIQIDQLEEEELPVIEEQDFLIRY